MNPISKILICTGITLIALGIIWQFGGRFLNLGKLPGDISIERENFRFYFPLASSILLSVVFSIVMYIVGQFKNR